MSLGMLQNSGDQMFLVTCTQSPTASVTTPLDPNCQRREYSWLPTECLRGLRTTPNSNQVPSRCLRAALMERLVAKFLRGPANPYPDLSTHAIIISIAIEHRRHFKKREQRFIKRQASLKILHRELNMRYAIDLHAPRSNAVRRIVNHFGPHEGTARIGWRGKRFLLTEAA